MRILFYSTKDFERPYLEVANKSIGDAIYIKDALSMSSVNMSEGFEAVSIFTGDDASTPVIEALQKNGVRFIAVRAAGYDNVDVKKAGELGMTVANVPEYSPYAIAEHAVALILALNRKIVLADRQVHQQDFTVGNLIGFDLKGKKVGVIGAGRIGGIFLRIMHGFGCKLLAHDIRENETLKKELAINYVDLDTLCKESDILSIHTCLTPETKYMINTRRISLMRPGTMIINTSRGACVDTAAMLEGLKTGKVGAYGADVYEKERGIFFYDHTGKDLDDPLLKRLLDSPKVLLTPHQAFATKEAITNIADTTFYNIACWKEKKLCVNELKAEG